MPDYSPIFGAALGGPRPQLQQGDDYTPPSQYGKQGSGTDWEPWALLYMPEYYQKYRDLIHSDPSNLRNSTEADTIRKAIMGEFMKFQQQQMEQAAANKPRFQGPGNPGLEGPSKSRGYGTPRPVDERWGTPGFVGPKYKPSTRG